MKYLLVTFLSLFMISCGGNGSTNEGGGNKTPNDTKEKIGTIASIKEASGICYVKKTDSLFVVGDNGFVYELDRKGVEINKKSFNSKKDHDFEGITYDEKKDVLYVAIEGTDNVMVLNTNLGFVREVNIARQDSDGVNVLEKEGEGIEGISVYNGEVYVSNQSFEKYPLPDSSVIVKLDSITNDKANISEVIDHGYNNISGMAFHNDLLYLVSDTGDLLIKYDFKNKQVISDINVKTIDKNLKKISLEGVTFDDSGYIYFALDDKENGKIVKYLYK